MKQDLELSDSKLRYRELESKLKILTKINQEQSTLVSFREKEEIPDDLVTRFTEQNIKKLIMKALDTEQIESILEEVLLLKGDSLNIQQKSRTNQRIYKLQSDNRKARNEMDKMRLLLAEQDYSKPTVQFSELEEDHQHSFAQNLLDKVIIHEETINNLKRQLHKSEIEKVTSKQTKSKEIDLLFSIIRDNYF